MRVLRTHTKPPVFWDRAILGYYVLCTTPFLLLISYNWFAFAAACLLLGVAGKVLELLVNKKGYDTGIIGIVVNCTSAMGGVVFVIGGFFYLLALYAAMDS